MCRIILGKDGFFKKKWHKEDKTYKNIPIEFDMSIFEYWRSAVEIEEDVTLGDLVQVLSLDNDTLMFIEMLTRSSIEPFLKEIDDDVKPYSDMDNIELSRYVDNVCDDLNIITGCSGHLKEPSVDPEFPEIKDEYCALDFTSWAALKHLPIVLNSKAKITLYEGEDRIIRECETYFTLGEFFDCLTSELCFHGSPKYRDEQLESLKYIFKRVEDGTMKTIPYEEVKRKLEEKLEGMGDEE